MVSVATTFPVASTTATLTPVRKPGIEPERRPCAGGCSEQQIAQVAGEDLDAFLFGELPEPHLHVEFDREAQLRPPCPPHGFEKPAIARSRPVGDAEGRRDAALIRARISAVRRCPCPRPCASRGSLPSRRETARGCDARAASGAARRNRNNPRTSRRRWPCRRGPST